VWSLRCRARSALTNPAPSATGGTVSDRRSPHPALASRLAQLQDGPARTGSIVITLYGDAIAPRGGSLAASDLTRILGAMGLNAGMVRTALSRLAADGWVARTRQGRASFYRLTDKGSATFAEATARIYGPAQHSGSGDLLLALLDPGTVGAAQRAQLEACGWGSLAPGVMLGLREPEAAPPPLLLRAEPRSEPDARLLAARAWPLERIAAGYQRFLDRHQGTEALGAGTSSPAGLDALLLRVLLIHDFRRVLLRDPMLPSSLLPEDWPGLRARALCAQAYRALVPQAEAWLDQEASGETGPLPPPGPGFGYRFGDLAAPL